MIVYRFARPSLDGTERHTALAEGKATRLSLLPHGECGAWGNAPQVKFRVGVRLPFEKGKEDGGVATCSEALAAEQQGAKPPLKGSRGSPSITIAIQLSLKQ